jgi:hypothetical protein
MYEMMISKDSVVAIRPNAGLIDNYFLFNVRDGVECLSSNVTNSGHFYSAGTRSERILLLSGENYEKRQHIYERYG